MAFWYTARVPHKQSPEPAIRREKLVIEKIGLTGLLFLWLNALAVAFFVPVICGIVLLHSLWIGILVGTVAAAAVGARAMCRIRSSLRQWQIRHRRLPADEVSSRDVPPHS